MKQIITLNNPLEYIAIANLPKSPVIGVIDSFNNKTFIIKTEYDNPNSYKFLSTEGVSTGNSYSTFNGNLKNVLSKPFCQYFLFQTEKELFQWLSEE